MVEFSNSPKGWLLTNLESISEIILGQSPPSSTYNENGEGLPFYQGKLEFGEIYPVPKKWCSSPKKISEKGDVLISVRAPVGPTNVCPGKSCIGRGLAAIQGIGGISPLFILYLIRSIENAIAGKGTGTTFNAITGGQLRSIEVPLPPLPEQRRIVAKIEELFTKLDAGVEALKKVKAQLKRYRQAVLKYAFEGKLTQEWREANKDKLEPASVLLERIKEERKRKEGGKLKEFPSVRSSDLSGLPREWVYVRIEDITSDALIGVVRSAHEQNKMGVGVPYIKMDKITMDGEVLLNDLVYVDASEEDIQRYSIKERDILFNTRNSVELVGKTGLVRGMVGKSIYNNNLMRIRTEDGVSSAFTVYQMCSANFRKRMERVKRSTTNVAAIYAKDLLPLPFVLPPPLEQIRIVEEIESRLSLADEVGKIAEQTLKQSERLRQSILKTAFEGKLAPQDPTDEPAEKLLERIKAEKAKKESGTKSRRKRSN